MKLRRWLLPTLMLIVPAIAFAFSASVDVAPSIVRVVSYWGYIAVTPALIVAFVVFGWLIPRKD
jgi:hypothetical protein